jgi:hypothetical protein
VYHRAFFFNRVEKSNQSFQQPGITTSIEEVTSTAKPIVREIRQFPQRIKKLIELLPHQEVVSLFNSNLYISEFYRYFAGLLCYRSCKLI